MNADMLCAQMMHRIACALTERVPVSEERLMEHGCISARGRLKWLGRNSRLATTRLPGLRHHRFQMYWPTSVARTLSSHLDEPIIKLRQNRRGNFFVTLTERGLGVWDVRPTVLQAALIRSPESVERWGHNVDVCWAHDGRGIIVLTSTSHLLVYQLTPTSKPSYDHPPSAQFPIGAGEGDALMGWTLKSLGVAFIMGGCTSVSAQNHSLSFTLRHPPSILTVPYPISIHKLAIPGSHHPPPPLDGQLEGQSGQGDSEVTKTGEGEIWELGEAKWLDNHRSAVPTSFAVAKTVGVPALHTLLLNDGSIWTMHLAKARRNSSGEPKQGKYIGNLVHAGENDKATCVSVNPKFGLLAVGTEGGIIYITPVQSGKYPLTLDLRKSVGVDSGSVTSLAWTSDGYAIAVGYQHAWAVWTVGGRLNGWAIAEGTDLFWAPGNVELFVLSQQLSAVPFAKSATTGIHSPDNTRYAFLQMDDKVLVYRGADQPDMSVINPESDVWQQIKIPPAYMATNWPVRYASISSDGKLVAIAGRRGLTHYSLTSGKWKLFQDERAEQDFAVRGGMLWFHHVLVVATEINKTYEIRLYSRDLDLSTNFIHSHLLPCPVLVMSLLDNSLLVYTADNTLYHFLIIPTTDSIKLHLCGSISFIGIVQVPSRVKSLSWLVPEAQKRLGDPADDLIVATIIFLVDGKLVLLRPRRAGSDEVRYDLQVLADKIESYWTHLHGVGTLENSLWGYDGEKIRVWLDALTIEHTRVGEGDAYESVAESISIKTDFYPLSILMDKGIIIGVDYETSTRLPFDIHKIQTSTHLFLPQFMRYHLSSSDAAASGVSGGRVDSNALARALTFASNYTSIVYFAHSLEILLHSVLEDAESPDQAEEPESQSRTGTDTDTTTNTDSDTALPAVSTSSHSTQMLERVVEFLDHFPDSLDVVVGCARKTELDRWRVLFHAVGQPRELFEACLEKGKYRTAAGYLLVLHHLEELDDSEDILKLVRLAMRAGEWGLCKELLRFLRSIDEHGDALKGAIAALNLLPDHDHDRNSSRIEPSISGMEAAGVPPTSNAIQGANMGAAIPSISVPMSESTSSTSVNSVHSATSASASASSRSPLGRITSPFQLESPRSLFSPPSPRTVGPGDMGGGQGKVPDALEVPTP